jgi:hypothetical protein
MFFGARSIFSTIPALALLQRQRLVLRTQTLAFAAVSHGEELYAKKS